MFRYIVLTTYFLYIIYKEHFIFNIFSYHNVKTKSNRYYNFNLKQKVQYATRHFDYGLYTELEVIILLSPTLLATSCVCINTDKLFVTCTVKHTIDRGTVYKASFFVFTCQCVHTTLRLVCVFTLRYLYMLVCVHTAFSLQVSVCAHNIAFRCQCVCVQYIAVTCQCVCTQHWVYMLIALLRVYNSITK